MEEIYLLAPLLHQIKVLNLAVVASPNVLQALVSTGVNFKPGEREG